MIMSRTLSADESYWKVFDAKAERAGVSASFLFRSMIEFMLDLDLAKGPDDLTHKWVKRGRGHAD